jgi:hypothetical protein
MSTASRQVWNWREDGAARREAALASLRRRGLVQGLAMLAVGTALNKLLDHHTAGRVVVVLGAVQAAVAMWRTAWLEPVQRLLARAGEAAGRGLAWLLLAPLWLVVFVPAGLWLRLRGRDPLHRAPLAPGLTAWIPRRSASTSESARRLFMDEDREARALERPVGARPDPSWWPDPDEGADR